MASRHFTSPFGSSSFHLSIEHFLKKRKYASSEEGSEEDTHDSIPEEIDHDGASQAAKASLTPDIVHQYQTAGQHFHTEPPRSPFPHRTAHDPTAVKDFLTPVRLEEELASLKPPLIHSSLVNQSRRFSTSSLKQVHLATLNMLAHRCLLQGDYIRAGRAFGMLLRTELRGSHPDIRAQGLWGIGAEILVRNNSHGSVTAERQRECVFSRFPTGWIYHAPC